MNFPDSSYNCYPSFIKPPIHCGREIFVSAIADSSTCDGSREYPYRHLQDAIDIASPGDTIYLRAGRYNDKVRISKCGSDTAWFLITPYQNEKVVFDNEFSEGSYCITLEPTAGYWKICGFEITRYTGSAIYMAGGKYYYIENMELHDLSNPEFSNNGTEGLFGSGANVLIRNCRIYDIGQDRIAQLDHCLYIAEPENWVIDSNILYNAPGGAIHQYCSGSPRVRGSYVYIWNNIIHDTYYGIVLSSCSDYYISNNTIRNSYFSDIYFAGTVYNSTFQNNIFFCDFPEGFTYPHGDWDKHNIAQFKPESRFIYCSGTAFSGNSFNCNLVNGKEKDASILD